MTSHHPTLLTRLLFEQVTVGSFLLIAGIGTFGAIIATSGFDWIRSIAFVGAIIVSAVLGGKTVAVDDQIFCRAEPIPPHTQREGVGRAVLRLLPFLAAIATVPMVVAYLDFHLIGAFLAGTVTGFGLEELTVGLLLAQAERRHRRVLLIERAPLIRLRPVSGEIFVEPAENSTA